jgi:hypothetical protein
MAHVQSAPGTPFEDTLTFDDSAMTSPPTSSEYLHQHEHKSLLRFITCGSVDDGKST